jgi:hypothetical protein
MPSPTNTLAGISWPQKRSCEGCGRVFFAFSPLRTECCLKCPGKLDATAKHQEAVAPAPPSEPRCNSGCSRCRRNTAAGECA